MKLHPLFLAVVLSGCSLFRVTAPEPETPPTVNVVERAVSNTLALVTPKGKFCSGVLVEGVALTAAHCVDGEPFQVETTSGKRYDVVVAAVDAENDLAVLTVVGIRVQGTVPLAPEAPGLGHRVVWLGYPLGHDLILGAGHVGNPSIEGGKYMAVYGQFLSGNSGGPVFNEFGELVGIVSATMATQDFPSPDVLPVGYSIHVNHVKSLINSL